MFFFFSGINHSLHVSISSIFRSLFSFFLIFYSRIQIRSKSINPSFPSFLPSFRPSFRERTLWSLPACPIPDDAADNSVRLPARAYRPENYFLQLRCSTAQNHAKQLPTTYSLKWYSDNSALTALLQLQWNIDVFRAYCKESEKAKREIKIPIIRQNT